MFNSAILDEVSSRMILFLTDAEPHDFTALKALSTPKKDEGENAPVSFIQ